MTPAALRTAREAEGLTQRVVADALGVSLRQYRAWETGEANVPAWVSGRAAVMVLRLLNAAP